MRKALVVAAFSVASCGSDTNCDFGNVVGSYLVHFVEKSGNCGPLPDIIGHLDGGVEGDTPAGCVVYSATENEAQCRADFDYACPSPQGNLMIRETGYRNIDADGSSLDGQSTFTATYTSNGALYCLSTYDVTYTRQ